jgi:hypothetical protein
MVARPVWLFSALSLYVFLDRRQPISMKNFLPQLVRTARSASDLVFLYIVMKMSPTEWALVEKGPLVAVRNCH